MVRPRVQASQVANQQRHHDDRNRNEPYTANPLLPSAHTPRSHTETGRAHSLPTMHTMYMAQDLRSRSASASAGGTSSMSESKGRASATPSAHTSVLLPLYGLHGCRCQLRIRGWCRGNCTAGGGVMSVGRRARERERGRGRDSASVVVRLLWGAGGAARFAGSCSACLALGYGRLGRSRVQAQSLSA